MAIDEVELTTILDAKGAAAFERLSQTTARDALLGDAKGERKEESSDSKASVLGVLALEHTLAPGVAEKVQSKRQEVLAMTDAQRSIAGHLNVADALAVGRLFKM